MTQTGKCDTCRSRKVKCDEQKPKCGACSKRDRKCTYSYGKVSTIVVEDPNQLSKHGKAKVAPRIYPLISFDEPSSSSASPSSDTLQVTTQRDADVGEGVFKTLIPLTKARSRQIRKTSPQQRRKLEAYLKSLVESSLATTTPSSPENFLATRYLNILGDVPLERQPFSILGTWIISIPSRIGHNRAVDLAAEFLADAFEVFRNENFSNMNVARGTKTRALRELALAVGAETGNGSSYDTLLAMKLHFAAEAFMGIKRLEHAIHSNAATEILKLGIVFDIDQDHFWNLVDMSYSDDVLEAMISGRTSVYDTEMYLTMSYPPSLPPTAPAVLRAATAIMHCSIQLPRLVCLVRHVLTHPEDTEILAMTVCLAETLWKFDPADAIQEILAVSVSLVQTAPAPEISDFVPDSYTFDSVQTLILITRYWALQIHLCALLENLFQHFPSQMAASLLPDFETIKQTDIDAAINQARCNTWTWEVCPSIPLVPMRVQTTLQTSITTWLRLEKRLNAELAAHDPNTSPTNIDDIFEQLDKPRRMREFVHIQCNRALKEWGVDVMSMEFIEAASIVMAGGPIPEWLPLRIVFEQEDGEIVMKMEYRMKEEEGQYLYKKLDENWELNDTLFSPPDRNKDEKRTVRKRFDPKGLIAQTLSAGAMAM